MNRRFAGLDYTQFSRLFWSQRHAWTVEDCDAALKEIEEHRRKREKWHQLSVIISNHKQTLVPKPTNLTAKATEVIRPPLTIGDCSAVIPLTFVVGGPLLVLAMVIGSLIFGTISPHKSYGPAPEIVSLRPLRCNDSWRSGSIGSNGACSYHGGVNTRSKEEIERHEDSIHKRDRFSKCKETPIVGYLLYGRWTSKKGWTCDQEEYRR